MEREEEEDNSARPRTIVGEPSEGVKGATGPGAWGLGYPSTGKLKRVPVLKNVKKC